MTRIEKYKLYRSLIELESETEKMVEYIKVHSMMDRLFNHPMEQIESWFYAKKEKGLDS